MNHLRSLLIKVDMQGVDVDDDWVSKQKPRAHGNGFLQFNVTPRARIHIWDKRLPNVRPYSQVHNHRRGFISNILAGELVNKIYRPVPSPDGDHIVYKCDSENHELVEQGEKAHLMLESSSRWVVGDRYRMGRDQFHTTTAIYCCTVIVQEDIPPLDNATAYSTQPLDKESKTYDRHGDDKFQELLWQVLKDTNEYLKEVG